MLLRVNVADTLGKVALSLRHALVGGALMQRLQEDPTLSSDTNFRAAFFDIDGTLLNSNLAHASAWSLALGEAGYDIPVERIKPLIGMGSDWLLPALCGLSPKSAEGKLAEKRSGEIFNERFLNTLEPVPGARRLLEQLAELGITFGRGDFRRARRCLSPSRPCRCGRSDQVQGNLRRCRPFKACS